MLNKGILVFNSEEEVNNAQEILAADGIKSEKWGALYTYCYDEAVCRIDNNRISRKDGSTLGEEEMKVLVSDYADRLYDSDGLIDFDEANDIMLAILKEKGYKEAP